ncbi:sensor histidine kinase [Pseudahrensia aquimaris]|uniref:histidine kinase n=1 Tax=Pseudahrensia aquimaris TaxID=744461 RepID=A0ABW3FBK9_9HYPH
MERLSQLLRVTAFRLSLIYTVLFGLLAIALVAFVSYNTSRLVFSQIRSAAQEEVEELSTIYNFGGAGRLINSIERRSRAPGAYLYLISDPQGRIIAGNVKSVDPKVFAQNGWSETPFKYDPLNSEIDGPHRAIAQVFDLPQGLRLLVGRDVGEANYFRTIMVQAIGLTLVLMVLAGLLLWFFIGRRALQRIDDVSMSSARIIAGDLSGRLPTDGSGDEFDRLADNLNSAISRIEKLSIGVRVMSDSIAHDLKTPLTKLRNRAEAALVTAGSTDRAAIEQVIEDADGILRTFDALLMISQVQSGSKMAKLSAVRMDEVCSDIAELFEPIVSESDAEFTADVTPALTVNGNRELLAQMITNLLDNAIKYGGNSSLSRIELSLKAEEEDAVLRVADNGSGIPEADRERVLERFVRLDASRTKAGTGLGLSLVDAVVELHGGTLKLMDNAPGLMIEVRLPISK